MNRPLPMTKEEMTSRGWSALDVIIVSGDAYVDHPSYGPAIIGRLLESEGYRVGIIAQPDPSDPGSFLALGSPELFFGVTSGNLDSMVANYTANRKPRGEDEYSAGGKAGLRPDRATLIYTNMLKRLFAGVPVVLGGLEASMRRLAHYDYWSDKVKRSILLDSKADILVYGMGERQITEIAGRLKKGDNIKDLDDVRGTVVIRNSAERYGDAVVLPSFEEVSANTDIFNEAFRMAYREMDPVRGRTLIQRHSARYIVQFPASRPMNTREMDRIYALPFTRLPHPSYLKKGGVPGFETVKYSVISHRGCPGECNFCSLYAHQGRIVQSRSEDSVLNEIRSITQDPCFSGTISDIGGPTVNLYKAHCDAWENSGACASRRCLVPEKCNKLKPGFSDTLRLWKHASAIPGVKHIFIGSGIRYDLLNSGESDEFLEELCRSHISGLLKVAPEHSSPAVLNSMGKPSFDNYRMFIRRYEAVNRRIKKKQHLVNYFITGHPGARLEDALELSLALNELHIYPEQIQDFIPLPMTVSGAMYHTGVDPLSGKPVHIAKNPRDRKLQRALVQFRNPENKRYVIEALRLLKRMDLMTVFYGGGHAKTDRIR